MGIPRGAAVTAPPTARPRTLHQERTGDLVSVEPLTHEVVTVAWGTPGHGAASYGPAGSFLPLVATKLTQSPWFLK
jgi:hypothetical protein